MNYEQKWGVGYNLNVNKEEKLLLIKKKVFCRLIFYAFYINPSIQFMLIDDVMHSKLLLSFCLLFLPIFIYPIYIVTNLILKRR